MRVGILSDTHDQLARTQRAVQLLGDRGVQALIHCGDFTSPPLLAACAVFPCWFVLGNNDADAVPDLERAAAECGAVCLGWCGVVELAGKKLGVAHGHLTSDVRQVLSLQPDYVLCGHAHVAGERRTAGVRTINPGALHRAARWTVAVLDVLTGDVEWLTLRA